jgi:3-isopropylmalate/(R)-2-methylmalate dehydratase small subunit
MERFVDLRGKTVPVPIKDIDTDLIIPAQFLTSVSRKGYGENLFKRLKESNPDFPLNRPEFANATILVSDSNFGCGSSREHAVWAITGAGFRVVIAKSFADIFSGNAGKNGLLLVVLSAPTVDKILESSRNGDYFVDVNLETQTVTLPDGTQERFDYDLFRRHCLLNGHDDLDYLLSHSAQISEWKKARRENLFYSTTAANN